jgi:hypothetical protein
MSCTSSSTLQTSSVAHKVICRLVDLGGTSKISRLIEVLSSEYQRAHMIQERVIEPLLLRGYVTQIDAATLRATPLGKDYAGRFIAKALARMPQYVGQIATARITKPSSFCRQPMSVYREGAFAYREIPSLMGGKRVLPNGEVVE